MKRLLTNVAKTIDKAKGKLMVASVLVLGNPAVAAWAKEGEKYDADKDGGKNIVLEASKQIIKVFPWFGAFFVISGFFKLVMAYRTDNPEAQGPAIKDIVIGAVLIGFGFIWDPISKLIF